ncbi:MAG: hypothetical protein WBD55_11900 [Dehalococcoidia bacterium]
MSHRSRPRISFRGAWLLLVLTLGLCVGVAWGVSLATPLPEQDTFNVLSWEAENLPNKWLYLAGRFFHGGLSSEEEDQRLGRYFLVGALMRRVDPQAPNAQHELEILQAQRDDLENDVEAIIEGRVTSMLEEVGLQASVPLFPNARLVFPPVDFEFDRPLQVVAVSPRDHIELIEQRPLRLDVTTDEIESIERQIDASGDRSALVEPVAGTATYPSIVAHQSDYERLVETVAHEWVHQYLFFRPLGERYFTSLELQTLNETLASMVGKEIASIVVVRYPLLTGVQAEVEKSKAALSEDEIATRLRRLRIEVDALLEDDRVDEAEALMERRRQELASDGVVFPRINQAFFAARSIYGDDPTSVDPIGRKLETLRDGSPTLATFLRTAAGLTSEAALDRAIKNQR